ncbi:tRNA dihydrouridine synthase, partial [Methylomagnum sp.]
LLREPARLNVIVRAVRLAVPAALPITAKMRLGYEDKSLAIACAEAIADGGAAELVVHARTKTEGYRPPAYWDWIGRIQSAVAIPVVANGEIWTHDDYRRCRDMSGVSDVMLGRGIVANPGLALAIKHGTDAALPWPELLPYLRLFWELLIPHVQPKHRSGRLKQWLNYLRRTYPEAEAAFENLRRINAPEEVERVFFGEYP